MEHSAILSTFIKLLFAIKAFVLSIFEGPLKTDFNIKVSYLEWNQVLSWKLWLLLVW